MLATMNGNDTVRFFLDHNADAHVRDNKGNTALHCAADFGHLEASRILLERNVEVNPQNNDGSTPLHLASSGLAGANPDIVQLLLDHGADAQLCDLRGKTASDVADGPNGRKSYYCSPSTLRDERTRRGMVDLSTYVSDDYPACLQYIDPFYGDSPDPWYYLCREIVCNRIRVVLPNSCHTRITVPCRHLNYSKVLHY
ncbi:ankyrin repeat-containing domain protein [Lactarius pseudohatsudake]|nr:ankyrin repeat-containing domain protein [Lactarius pseudohatsudake]